MVSEAAERSRRQRAEIVCCLGDVVMNRKKRGFSGMGGCIKQIEQSLNGD